MHIRFGVSPLRVKSIFPPILCSSCNQALLSFKAKSSGDSSSLCQTSGLGSLTWGSECSLLWENLCNIIILQFADCLPRGYGIQTYRESAPPTGLTVVPYVFSCRSFLVYFSPSQCWFFCRFLWLGFAHERRWAQGPSPPSWLLLPMVFW